MFSSNLSKRTIFFLTVFIDKTIKVLRRSLSKEKSNLRIRNRRTQKQILEILSQEEAVVESIAALISNELNKTVEGVGASSHFNWIYELSAQIYKKRELVKNKDAENHKDLNLKVQKLDYKLFSMNQWDLLRYVSGCNGLYSLAYEFRQKSITHALSLIELKRLDTYDILKGFNAALESGNYKLLENYYKEAKKIRNRIRLPFKEIKFIYRLIIQNNHSKFHNSKTRYLPVRNKYGEYLLDKHIAVVGPADTGEIDGNEIDSFDIIVRPSYRGKNPAMSREGFGSLPKISYYGNDFSRFINGLENHSFFNEIFYTNFKAIKHEYQVKRIFKTNYSRDFNSLSDLFFTGSPTMILNIVMDLITFRPMSIKIFKANLFLSNTPYAEGYKYEDANLSHNWYGHWHHDIVSQFNLTKLLWKQGIIEVDNNLTAILNKSTSEYISDMEKIYS